MRFVATIAAVAFAASGCSAIRPPLPAEVEAVWDGELLRTTSPAPLEGEALVTVINRDDKPVSTRLFALGGGDLTPVLERLRFEGGLSQLEQLDADALEARRREPGRVAPRLIEDRARFHLHLPPGGYLLVMDDGSNDTLSATGWLSFVVSPR